MQTELVLAFILLLLSAFFSSAEIAFIVANKVKIGVKAHSSISARIAQSFVNKPENFLITILIGNNLVNIAFSSLLTLVLKTTTSLNDFTILILITFVLLIFGESLPKSIARESADKIVLIASLPLKFFYFIFLPAVRIINFVSERILKIMRIRSETIKQFFSKHDIEVLIKESEASWRSFIEIPFSKVFKLETLTVREAMIPRTEIVGVEKDTPMREVFEIFSGSGHSKLPVYEKTLDNIIGIIYVKDLFKNPRNISEIIKEPFFVPEQRRCIELLRDFKERGTSIAIVVDEFGGVSGLITLEDLIEELVGEIEDEFDTARKPVQKIDQNTFILNGLTEVDFLNEEFNLNIPKGDYETIAGFVIKNIGRIPTKGEEFMIGDFKITILSATQTKINTLKLTVQR